LKTELISQEKNVIVLKAKLEAEGVSDAVEKTYKDLSKKANIRGFRKGHIPRKAIDLYFSKKSIYAETADNIISDAIQEMIEDYDLKPIAEPDVRPSELEEGKPFSLEVTFEVTPEVTLPELESVEAEKTIYVPTEKMLEENIARILEAHSEIVPTYEDREIIAGDFVSIKYNSHTVENDGSLKLIEENQKIEIPLAVDNIRPEFIDAIAGKKPGDSLSVELKIEEDAENKEIAGKTIRYDIEILGIMKKQKPDLTDETVEKITHSKYTTVDDFKAAMMEQLNAAAQRESEESLRVSAVAKVCDLAEVEIPESLITKHKNFIRSEQDERMKRESGVSLEESLARNGIDKEQYEAELDKSARYMVKRSLVLEAIAEANDINWSQAELDAELRRMAMASHLDPQKFREYVYGDRNRLFDIAEKIRDRKTIDFITSKVKVLEIPEKKTEEAEEAEEAEKAEDASAE
jgi:trigger factor